ncbi:MAG: hypothetical protein Kow0073_15890 [Immundisolibacter sp.]
MRKSMKWAAAAAVALVLAGPALAEALRGGGRIGEVNLATGVFRVDATQLRIEALTRVFDYGGKPVSASALEAGMSVSYTALPGAEPGQPALVQEVRMVPN